MKVTWFGHSAFRLDFADKAVLIDPFFTGNPGFEGDRAKIVAGVTHVLITHGHGDHIGDEVSIEVDLGIASGEFTVYGCDLTEGYIRINADYTT